MAPQDCPFSGFASVSEEKPRESAPFQAGRLLEKPLLGAADARDEPVRLLFCGFGSHGVNVCRRGTHFKTL